MLLHRAGQPLAGAVVPDPVPGRGEVLIDVAACGVCRTDLHIADGELADAKFPLILGHEIVGRVAALGDGVTTLTLGQRVGVPWLGWTCGTCEHCRAGRENLCVTARFTGYHRNGGYAERCVADARYCFSLPGAYDDVHAAPLLCAGLIGHRALAAAGDAATIGLYGFGAAAHIVVQVARGGGRRVVAFTRPGDDAARRHAMELGCAWAGDSDGPPPEPLDAAILFAPVGALVPVALRAVRPGGTVVCAGIHMSDIPAMPYAILWGERVVRSVANLTRADGEAFFATLSRVPVTTTVTPFPLAEANTALARLRAGAITGAAVLIV